MDRTAAETKVEQLNNLSQNKKKGGKKANHCGENKCKTITNKGHHHRTLSMKTKIKQIKKRNNYAALINDDDDYGDKKEEIFGSCDTYHNKTNSYKNDPKPLLISYIYPIDVSWAKIINIGIDFENFYPVVYLQDRQDGSYIRLNLADWLCLTSNKENIVKLLTLKINQSSTPQTKFVITEQIDVYSCTFPTNGDAKICITRKEHVHNDAAERIELTMKEWFKIMEFHEMILQIFFFYQPQSDVLKAYFEQYVEKCIELNTLNLEGEYGIPLTPNKKGNFNFKRLFFEIGILCRERIVHCFNEKKLLLQRSMGGCF